MLYTKDKAQSEIIKLVAQFKQEEATLVNAEEAMIENNFIRPLFRFLNWNVDNFGLSEPQWEFVLQRTTREGNRPDYILQLEGQHLFVMDAKKVKYDMHDPRWLNQVYAYAYSTQNNAPAKKIDFAILTDFQEFIVLDCTLLANNPAVVKNFRVIDWQSSDYVDHFDELWELFERNNVLAASRERKTGIWARYLSPNKVQANRIPPDKAFLSALDDEKDGWRVRLAKDMKAHDKTLDGNALTAAVQLLIDRLIFVKVLSDREIERDYLTQMAQIVEDNGLADDDHGWFAACQNLFTELHRMYNGSVFTPRQELEKVIVNNSVVRGIIDDLLPENSPYNFAVLPVEILGTIYERFLGRVVYATDARVKIEDKPEVRKAGGVYYTPQYIVDYIVKNTVGKLLADCKTPADAAKLKILDPACGSGSFLLGAYDALIEWHRAHYQSIVARRRASVKRHDPNAYYVNEDRRVRLTARLKRQILLNNLFGVDIDPQAVEVTRLSLSLKALEDTRSDEAHNERTLFNQSLLPDLSGTIKCGNSLVGNDYSLIPQERVNVNAFEWRAEFVDVMNAGGFDAVIGNPPYAYRNATEEALRPYYEKKYRCAQGNFDVYKFFIERGHSLARANGYLGQIVSATFMIQPSFAKLRGLLVESTIERLAPLGPKAFDAATVDTTIIVLRKSAPKETHQIIAQAPQRPTELDATPEYSILQSRFAKNEGYTFDYRLTDSGARLLNRLFKKFPTIETGYEFGVGINTGFIKSELVADSKLDKRYHPMVAGDGIARYGAVRTTQWIMYDKEYVKGRGELGRTLPSEHLLSSPKILVVRTRNLSLERRIIATIDATKVYNLNRLSNIIARLGYNLYGLLGILNSQLFNWIFSTRYYDYEIKPVYLRSAPLANSNDERLIRLVEQMLDLHKRHTAARTETEKERYQRQIDATDMQMDALVYRLYSLSAKEIAIVEAN